MATLTIGAHTTAHTHSCSVIQWYLWMIDDVFVTDIRTSSAATCLNKTCRSDKLQDSDITVNCIIMRPRYYIRAVIR